jgi:HEAT repeat protein
MTLTAGCSESYNLNDVKGIEVLAGSTAARELLQKNGFVVADPAFNQIFEPYIRSPDTGKPSDDHPEDSVLPAFITVDSAWDTYHVLLEAGVKKLEEVQSARLHRFSRQLLGAVSDPKTGDPNLVWFAGVGLALQDELYRKSASPEVKQIVDGLRNGGSQLDVPVGFQLSPLLFRAQGFYIQSPELTDYFAARQWYASVVFRLDNAPETRSAVRLSAIIDGDAGLSALWQQLSAPFDALLARAEDGTIREYAQAAKSVLPDVAATTPISDAQIAAVQKTLEKQLPLPRINDQQLSPGQFAEFAEQTRGFRLLPSRQLPCAVCFQNSTAPVIPGRTYPSGLDFLAASPTLRSLAAVRALQAEFGKPVSDRVLKTDCGPMPDSLYGESMQLLSTLQKSLPARAPAPLRTEAWSDLQLWTQLGAWAEQRHTWALHAKLDVGAYGGVTPPPGMVAPYPDFFSGLAKLSRHTAEVFCQDGLEPPFEAKAVAGELRDLFVLENGTGDSVDRNELEKIADKLQQFREFQNRYDEKHSQDLKKNGSSDGYKKLETHLEDLARRCATNGTTDATEIETLRMFYDCRQSVPRLLNDFAPVCDRLAELANKSRAGRAQTEDDDHWIRSYGVTLAGFHFYYGDSYEVPRDDFPIVTRIFSSPLTSSMLYAGLARPRALYVIIPNGKTLQLYRGAVMTYREFARPDSQLLDDESWRDMVSKGATPPAPSFTRSFCAETSMDELLKRLRLQADGEDGEAGGPEDIQQQITTRATDKDLPVMLDALVASTNADDSLTPELGQLVGRLNWTPYRDRLRRLVASKDTLLADAATYILLQRPADLEVGPIISDFAGQSSRLRRLYCLLLGAAAPRNMAAQKLLLDELNDANDGIRWQAAVAIGNTNLEGNLPPAGLLAHLNDTNQFVACAAVVSLVQLKATNSAPELLARLKTQLQAPGLTYEEWERQTDAIRHDIVTSDRPTGRYSIGRGWIMDPCGLTWNMYRYRTDIAAKTSPWRGPPMPHDLSDDRYYLVNTLIRALGELRYKPAADEIFKLRGTEYDADALLALGKIAPDRLSADLLATARNQQIDSYIREQALVNLGDISATNRVRELLPLLDDRTPIEYSTDWGREWRICDRAAATIAILLGWEKDPLSIYYRQEKREALMRRIREWAGSTTESPNR